MSEDITFDVVKGLFRKSKKECREESRREGGRESKLSMTQIDSPLVVVLNYNVQQILLTEVEEGGWGTRFDGEFLIKTIFILILLSNTNVNDIFYHCAAHTVSGQNMKAVNKKYKGLDRPLD